MFTFYALFGADIKSIFFYKRTDSIFNYITIACVCTMFSEIIMNTIIDIKYCGSFYFWLDLLCKVTYVFDFESSNESLMNFFGSSAEMAKTGKAGRLGA